MIVLHRHRNLYKLCVLCTLFMFTTSVLNITFIIRQSLTKRTDHVPSSLWSLSSQDHEIDLSDNQSNSDFILFEETYRRILHVIGDSYSSVVNISPNHSSLYCQSIPPGLKGPSAIKETPRDFSLFDKSPYHPQVLLGGHSYPRTCAARHQIAIIVPYRDRWEILEQFLYHTHTLLDRQQINYRMYVCEQAYNKTFNKGIVMNGCFIEILRLEPNTPCFIMHDVDLLSIDDRNMYTCPTHPRHLSVAIDKFHFYLPYKQLVGGVLALRREHYILVNGYSTNYWGWGGEDDDMHERIVNKNLTLERPPAAIARYKMLKHTHQKLNPSRLKVLRSARVRINSDGLNNVKYTLLNTTLYHLFTHFLIDVGEEVTK